MLLKFAVTNFLSIREEAEISFVAAALKDMREVLIPSTYATHGVLPVLAVYGANASGKSNALRSLSYMRWFVLNSFRTADKKGTGRKPFRLDSESPEKDSRFVLDFVLGDVRYQFGMAVSRDAVTSEWLYQYPRQARQVLYEREGAVFKFGRALQGSNRQIESITRPNALFLSTAATSNHPELTKVRDYFRDKLILEFGTDPDTAGARNARAIESDVELRAELVRQLALADTGIAEIRVERSPMDESLKTEMKGVMEALTKLIGKISPEDAANSSPDPDNEDTLRLKLGHSGKDGKVHFLDFSDESMGTQYLVALLPSMLRALKAGAVLILDEITTGLHTLLARQLVALFHDRSINKRGAQLIFSTHDTNLLSPGVMRRDEIWFAEKGSDGSTTLFPLTDIKTKNTDNIERGYLQGRFGAVPVLSQSTLDPA